MVRTALHNHTDIRCHGEEFNVIAGHNQHKTKEEVLQKIYGNSPPAHASGFLHHLHIFSILRPRHNWATLQRDLVQAEQMKVIHIHRRNMLRQYVSNAIAKHTQMWHRTSEEMEHSLHIVKVNPEKLIWNFKKTLELRQQAIKDFSRHDQMILTYEEVVDQFDIEMCQVQEFLEVSPRKLKPITLQQEIRPLEEMIENYDEIVKLLKGTEYESFID
jgi:hypothetical protein